MLLAIIMYFELTVLISVLSSMCGMDFTSFLMRPLSLFSILMLLPRLLRVSR